MSKDCSQDYPTEPIDSFKLKIDNHYVVKVENSITFQSIWLHILSLFIFSSTFKGAHWAVKALKRTKELASHNHYDYVLTKNTPSFLLGYYLKNKYGIKWVATWNDPYPGEKYPYPYGKGKNYRVGLLDRLQIRVMKKADIHIFPSARIRDYMLSYLAVGQEKCIVIPHVALNIERNSYKCSEQNVLKMIHSGVLSAPRNPRPFLKALSRFYKLFPKKKIQITFMGKFDDDIPSLIDELGLDEIIVFKKPVSYQNSLSILSNYHICLIIEADCEEGIFLPTKVSDFFQCGKRIFALSPRNGVLHDLYQEKCIPYFSYVNDENEIFEELCKVYQEYEKGIIGEEEYQIPCEFSESVVSEQYYSL